MSPALNIDQATTAELLTAARRHAEAWQTLTHLLNDAPGHFTPERVLEIWLTAEDHAERAAELMNAARLRLAEQVSGA